MLIPITYTHIASYSPHLISPRLNPTPTPTPTSGRHIGRIRREVEIVGDCAGPKTSRRRIQIHQQIQVSANTSYLPQAPPPRSLNHIPLPLDPLTLCSTHLFLSITPLSSTFKPNCRALLIY